MRLVPGGTERRQVGVKHVGLHFDIVTENLFGGFTKRKGLER